MFKRVIAIVIALSLGLATAIAAQPPTPAAKVVAVEGNKVQLAVDGDLASWMRKGAVAKVSDEKGELVESAAKITEVAGKTLTLTTRETPSVKVGQTVTLQKGRVMSGC